MAHVGHLALPAAVIAALLACQPPVDSAEPPRVSVLSPDENVRINEGTSVTVEVAVKDSDGDAPIEVKLQVDGTEVDSATLETSEGTVTLETPALTQGSRMLKVIVSDEDGEREAERPVYVNGAPGLPVITLEPANPTPEDEVRAVLTAPAMDPDGDVTLTSWAWKRADTTALTGATFPAILPASLTERGDVWTLEVEVWEAKAGERDPEGLHSSTSYEIAILNEPPSAPRVSLLPSTPHPLTPLRCTADGSVDPQGAAVSYAYAWSRDRGMGFVDQPALTGPILAANNTRAGDIWRCSATATDGDAFGDAGTAEVTVVEDLVSVTTIAHTISSVSPDRTPPVALELDATPGVDLVLTGVPSGGDGAGRVDGITPAELTGWDPAELYDVGTVLLTPVGGQGVGGALALLPDLAGDALPDLAITDAVGGVWVIGSEHIPVAGAVDLGAVALRALGTPGWTTTAGAGNAFGGGRAELFFPWLAGDGSGSIAVFPSDVLAFPVSLDPATAAASAIPDDGAPTWGQSMDVGDLNNDGTADLAIGVPREGANRRCAAVFSGGLFSTGEPIPELDALVTILGDPGEGCGKVVRFLPDLDGDGDQELAVSLPDWSSRRGRVAILAGGTRVQVDLDLQLGDITLVIEGQNPDDDFGAMLSLLGDVDGDGTGDIAIGAPLAHGGNGRLYLYSGAALGAAMAGATVGTPATLRGTDADWRLDSDGVEDISGVAGMGDLDGDGQTDLVVHGALGTSWFLLTGR